MLITFSGLDGSGKSTVIEGIRSKRPEFKTVHIVNSRLVNRILALFSGNKAVKGTLALQDSGGGGPRKKALGAANLFFLLFDIIFFRVMLSLSRRPVLCDRYFYDLLAVHIHRHGEKSVPRLMLGNNPLVPKPDIAFLIEPDYEMARKREKGGSHSAEYFESLKSIYDGLKKRIPFEVVENKGGEPPVAPVLERIDALALNNRKNRL